MAYMSKVIDANETDQGDAIVATSPKNFKVLETVFPDGVTFADVSGDLDGRYTDVRYYTGDLAT